MARFGLRRDKEITLQYQLQKICSAIDRHHDLRIKGVITAPPVFGQGEYPRTLDELTKPLELLDRNKLVFVRPSDLIDPMTGTSDWRTNSSSDDADSLSSNDHNVWDVHSSSNATSLDGKTK